MNNSMLNWLSMFKEPSELDVAQLKHEMRQMYSHLGFNGSLQVLYEMLFGARILSEIMVEERAKNDN